MKLDRTLSFNQVKNSVVNALTKIKKKHYENYFKYAYRKEELRTYESKKSTRWRKTPKYKD